MKHRLFAFILFLVAFIPGFANEIDVPHHMEFAGIQLRIKESARRKIAETAEKLRTGGKYFQLKLDRINLYFPIIERVLAEEGLPGDFKYLVIQESDLLSDAVSTSNAVGFWQFKKTTAQEVGLTVNGDVDERKHIVASTRAAARYLKKNNFFMQNWLHALLSYNMGVGGCRALVGDKDKGVDRMDIDSDTHWYILKFLAHRVAFSDEIGKSTPSLALLEYHNAGGKTLQQVARELGLDEEQLASYNKWLDKRRIPDDKDYTVLIPAPLDRLDAIAAQLNAPAPAVSRPKPVVASAAPAAAVDLSEQAGYPQLRKDAARGAKFYKVNGKPGIMAQAGDNSAKLADQAGVPITKFLKYNDLQANTMLVPGQVYYLKRKRSKAKIHYHVATEGETLWQISQKYGVTLNALLRKNRMHRPEKIKHGQVVWLRYIRPASTPVEIKNIPKPESQVAQKEVTKPSAKPITKSAEKNIPAAQPTQESVATTSKPSATVSPEDTRKPAEQSAAPAEVAATSQTSPAATATGSAAPPLPEKTEPSSTASLSTAPAKAEAEPLIFLKTHEVATGQTLYAIAKLYAVSVADLRKWNNLGDTDGLKVGQKLIVGEESAEEASHPSAATPVVTPVSNPDGEPAVSKEYTVQSGDTLYKISKQYGVSVQQLMDWNNKTTPTVSIGEILKVKQ